MTAVQIHYIAEGEPPTCVLPEAGYPAIRFGPDLSIVLGCHPDPATYLRTLADRASTLADECERAAVRSS